MISFKHNSSREYLIKAIFLLCGIFLLLAPRLGFTSPVLTSYWDLRRVEKEINSTLVDYLVLKDTSGILAFKDILSAAQAARFKSISLQPSIKSHDAVYWIKLPFKNAQPGERWVLEIQSLHTPLVEFYLKNEAGDYVKRIAGHALPFHQKNDYKVKNIVFELPFFHPNETVCYLRIKSNQVSHFYFKIHSTKNLIEYTVTEYLLLGMYYGILLIIAVYNLALYITTKESIHLLYVPYILSCILSSLTEDGLGFAYLWPDHPALNISINYTIAPLFFMMSFLIYSRKFLDINKYRPRAETILWSVTGLYLVYWVFSLFYDPGIYISQTAYSIPFVCIYIISIYSYVKGFKPARYFIMAYSLIVVAILIGVLRIYGIFIPSIWIVYSFNIGLIAEACVMSYAIGDKVRIISDQQKMTQNKFIIELERNNELQNKVNKELEVKVSERTQELNKANSTLEALSSELQIMNSKLDYDNWHLKQKIVEEKRESVLSKVVSFQDFQLRFPNEYTCQSYIESIKWTDEQFKCRKCGNDKYNNPKGSLSRKCTRCDDVESVTANSLFHGTRFPLVKAFYIIHVVVNDIREMNIEELAITLGVAKNTCWKFRKKVEDRLKTLKKHNVQVSSWEVLIKNDGAL